MTLEFEVDVDYLTDGGIKDMPTWVKLNDEGGERTSTVYVNTSSYWHVVDENAKLREELEVVGTAAYLYGRDDLKAENAKLRELVADMYAVIRRNNSWWDWECKDRKRFADRMRELGMEVQP